MSQSRAQQARNRLGGVCRNGTPEQITEARREATAASLADWIKRKLAAAPPLSEEQLAQLRALLTPASGAGTGDAA
jgi:hypothetical protein